MKKYIAELLGTFALTFVVGLSLAGQFPVATPLLAALTLGLFVYTVGHISGTHLNPAITLALLSIKKIGMKDALAYLCVQFLGAFLASYLINVVSATASLNVVDSPWVLLAEGMGAFFFAFGVAAVVYGRVPKDMSGFGVGLSLFLGISFAALMHSNGVLNPAVAFGIGSFGMMYVLGPVVGAVAGMQVYKYLSGEKK